MTRRPPRLALLLGVLARLGLSKRRWGAVDKNDLDVMVPAIGQGSVSRIAGWMESADHGIALSLRLTEAGPPSFRGCAPSARRQSGHCSGCCKRPVIRRAGMILIAG